MISPDMMKNMNTERLKFKSSKIVPQAFGDL